MLIELYEQSEVIKQNRLAAEEAERKRKEDEKLREMRRERYNDEVEKTIALMNIVQDYDMACKIRAFVSSLESSGDMDEKKLTLLIGQRKKLIGLTLLLQELMKSLEKGIMRRTRTIRALGNGITN